MLPAADWYPQGGKLELQRGAAGWHDKLARALSRGYPGMRVSGNTAWLQRQDWREFCEYEEQINGSSPGQRMTILCTYPVGASPSTELPDVLRTHQFAIARRQGVWEIVETPQLRHAKSEIERLTRELAKSEARLRRLADAIPPEALSGLPDDVMKDLEAARKAREQS